MLRISATIAVMRCPSICPSVTFVSCAKTNKDIFEFFSPSGSQAIVVFPCQTGWRYTDGNSPDGGVECRWSIGRNRDSGLIAAAIEDCWRCEVSKTFTDDKAEYMTKSATHYWLSIDCSTCELRSDKNSYRRPCSLDRTVGDAPANVCL